MRRLSTRVFSAFAAFAVSVAVVFGVAGLLAVPLIRDQAAREQLTAAVEYTLAHLGRHGTLPPPSAASRAYLAIDDLPLELRDEVRGLAAGLHELRPHDRELWIARVEAPNAAFFVVHDVRHLPFATWRRAILAGAALVLSAGLLLGWLSAKRLTRPLERLATLTRDTPAARLAEALECQPLPDELHALAVRFAGALRAIDEHAARDQRFTRFASHELRTPVTVIRGAVELLRTAPAAAAPGVRAPLDRIERAGLEMETTIEAFLWLARDHAPVADGHVLLQPVAERVVERHRHVLGEKPVAVSVEGRASLGVSAPQAVLEIALGNLVANAFHYTERGSVRIVIEENQVCVVDTGPGVSIEDRSGTLRRVGRSGHGLGLAIVASLCERFGWRMSFDATPGVGTRARLQF